MPILTLHPHYRIQFTYGDTVTVLEGRELELLHETFERIHEDALRKLPDNRDNDRVMSELLLSIVRAYQDLYGWEVVTQEDLRRLSTPDARKLDLFYKGQMIALATALYPNDNWERIWFEGAQSPLSGVWDAVEIKPGAFGVSIDLKKLFSQSRAFFRKKSKSEPRSEPFNSADPKKPGR